MNYEYVLIDRDGVSREDFDSRAAAVAELQRIERAHPGATENWMLATYDEAGNRVRESWSDELIAVGVSFVIVGEGVGLFGSTGQVASSGTERPSPPWFRRRPRVAKGTLARAEAGTAGAK